MNATYLTPSTNTLILCSRGAPGSRGSSWRGVRGEGSGLRYPGRRLPVRSALPARPPGTLRGSQSGPRPCARRRGAAFRREPRISISPMAGASRRRWRATFRAERRWLWRTKGAWRCRSSATRSRYRSSSLRKRGRPHVDEEHWCCMAASWNLSHPARARSNAAGADPPANVFDSQRAHTRDNRRLSHEWNTRVRRPSPRRAG